MAEMPTPPRRPRPEGASATRRESGADQLEAEGLLPSLLARISALAELDNRNYFQPDLVSSLGVDDAAIYPLLVSSAPRLKILSSIDHLQTVASIVDAGTLPMVALVSLLRSAIETSCSAIYLLAPDDRATRVRRALRDEYFQIDDNEKMTSDMWPAAEIDRARYETNIRGALAAYPAAGDWPDISGGRSATITKQIEDACPVIEAHTHRSREEFAVRGLWRGFSGMTHGRTYAALAILDREELAYDDDTGIVTAHMTFGVRSLVGTAAVALDVVETAVKIYGQRARTFTNRLEDVELVSQLQASGRM